MAKKKQLSEMSPAELQKEIKGRFGTDGIMMGSDPRLEIRRIPCGMLSIDTALGGGFPMGRHTEIFGGYGVGKTYVTYRLIAKAQKDGHECAFIDAENGFDPSFAESCGVDLEALYFKPQRKHANELVDYMEMLLYSKRFGVIALDSIASLLPLPERDANMSKASMGMEQAKLMSKAMRKLTTANSDTAIIYLNQTRDAVGSMFKSNVTSGGRAMEFYAGTRLEFVRIENIKKTREYINPKTQTKGKRAEVIGHRVLVRIEKDKTGSARRHSDTSFLFNYLNSQADPVEDLLFLGRKYDLVRKEGTKKYYVVGWEDDARSGKANFKKWLRSAEHVQEELTELIWEAWEAERAPSDEQEDSEDDSDE